MLTMAPRICFPSILETINLPAAEKKAIMEKMDSDIAKLSASVKPAPPPMEPSEYLSALAALDVTDVEAVEDFIYRTQLRATKYLPKPIPFGTHAGREYFLVSGDETLPLDESARPNGTLYEAMSSYTALGIPMLKPITLDLKYGFGVGRLHSRSVTESKTPPIARELDDAGFYIVCSAIDKSIWAIFDFEPQIEIDDYITIDPRTSPYGTLQNDTEDLVIGVQKLFGSEWLTKTPFALDGGDPFKSALGGSPPVAAMVTAKEVTVEDVRKRYVPGLVDDNGV